MDEQLHKAIIAGHFDEVQSLINRGANLNSIYGMKVTPLCAAIYANQPSMVKLLLDSKCNINAKDFDGEPPLCLAIRTKRYHLAEKLLAEDTCNVNKVDPVTGLFPLHTAVLNGHLPTVKLLISRKCQLNLRDTNDNTALLSAIINEQKDIAKFLIDSGCSLFTTNSSGELPLHASVRMKDTDVLNYILNNIDVTVENQIDGYRYIDYPTQALKETSLIRAVIFGNEEAVTMLLKIGCDVNIQTFNGETALSLACRMNFQNIAANLLEAGADPNVLSEKHGRYHLSIRVTHQSPIKEAITLGNLFLVKKLLHCGADLNLVHTNENTPLCTAFLRNKAEIASTMLDFIEEKNIPIFDIYKCGESHINYPLIAVASCVNPAYFAKRLIALGANVNYMQRVGGSIQTPLLNAVEFECVELAEVLLEMGADTETYGLPLPALQLSASEGCLPATAALIQWGADINNADPAQTTALQYALSNGNFEIARMLLENGAKAPAILPDEMAFESWCTDDESEELNNLIQLRTNSPLPLTFLVRNVVNTSIKRGLRTLTAVSQLALPNSIKDFLRYKHLDACKHLDW